MPTAFTVFSDSLKTLNIINENPKKALELINTQAIIYKNDSLVISKIFLQKSDAFNNLNLLDSAKNCLENAYAILSKNKNIAEEDYIQNLIRLTYLNTKFAKYSKALTYIKEAEEIINNSPHNKENKYIFLQGSMNSAYANVLSSFNEVEKSLAYNKKSIECFLQVPKVNNISDRYFDLALDFEDLNEPDSAIYYTKVGISKIFSAKDSFAYYFAYKILGDIYNQKHLYDSTIYYSKKAMEYTDPENKKKDKALLVNLSTAYFKTGDLKNLKTFYSVAKQAQLEDTIATTTAANRVMQLLNIAVATKKINDVDTLLKYYYSANKKNFEMEKAIAYQNMQVQYEVKAQNIKIEKLNIEKELIQTRLNERTLILLSILLGLLFSSIILRQRYKHKQRKDELNKLLLEQRLLRTQMNPHFIFNSIAVVHSLIEENENNKATNFLSHFSKLLRNVLQSSTQNFVTLANEIEILSEYLLLQKIRMVDKFEFKIHIDDTLKTENILLPPMLLQPFVENAIEHGIRPSNEFGLIEIYFYQKTNYIECIIEDNGVGFLPEKNKNSLSTQLITERLTALGKKQKIPAGVTISSKNLIGENKGTTVNIKIPIRYD